MYQSQFGQLSASFQQLLRSLGPVDRLDQLGGAVGADVQPASGVVLVAEADHLDAAPAGEHDASD